MRVAIIGANGNFGLKRLKAGLQSKDSVTFLCDLHFGRALEVCGDETIALETDYRRLLDEDFDIAIISLPDYLKLPVTRDFLKAGKHVLVEKPLSLCVSDVKDLFSLAHQNQVCLYAGYNLRFFPSVRQLLELLREKFFGNVHFIRLFHGHGGIHTFQEKQSWRIGESSWGGSFVDMGTHLLRLARQFVSHIESGVLEKRRVISRTVEDNCTALLKSDNCLIEFTSSWTTWRSRFSVEVYGDEGFAELDGLVKYVKYGQTGERIRYGRKNPSGPPLVTERFWTVPEGKSLGGEFVNPFSAEVEFVDQEWQWFRESIAQGSFDIEKEERENIFVAEIYERFYQWDTTPETVRSR